ncbi:PREDICTED: 3 beta-hydroxysteroid dehydrogenase/Delta 5--_4-isomerase type 6-like, partial [Priapulus caudatus]|uniref:3 beta-hydroxysteroid dehydrogenase/Delta 5-->4-isomerase type 6-like n=1 Tax=Priapulus caudatus TaxID=37621 RepID=A0ABM1F741_PRICU
MMSEAASENKTVLVTGANGFVGQHVVKLLQLRAPYIEEIRVVDLQPFSKRLEYEDRISVKSYVGDICDINDMYKACRGVDAVIHVAGVVSFGTYPDVDAMQRVNVQGTQRVVEACIETSVPRLVFTSTIDVAVG